MCAQCCFRLCLSTPLSFNTPHAQPTSPSPPTPPANCVSHPTGHPGPPGLVVRHGHYYHPRPHRHGDHTHSFSQGPRPSSSPLKHRSRPSSSPFRQEPHPSNSQLGHGSRPSSSPLRQGPHPSSSQLGHGPRPQNPSPSPSENPGVPATSLPPELVDHFGALYSSSQWGNPPVHPHDQD